MQEDCKQRLEEALRSLPDKERIIMRLHLAGESQDLIGKVFRITQQAVSKQVRRITTTLAAKCTQSDGAFE